MQLYEMTLMTAGEMQEQSAEEQDTGKSGRINL